MPSDAATALELIDEARFARRMLGVVDASLTKIEAAIAPPLAGPTRLEVPTVNAAGWSDAVLYVVRTERAQGRAISEIAAMLERILAVEVTPQVLLAGVMHFDLDRHAALGAPVTVEDRVEADVPATVPALPPQSVTADPAADWRDEARRLYDGGRGPTLYAIAKRLGVTDIAVRRLLDPRYGRKAPAEDRKPVGAPAGPRKAKNATGGERLGVAEGDVALREPWAQEAIRLYDGGLGLSPGSIATKLDVSDFKVRCLLIPGFRDRAQQKIRDKRGNMPKQYAPRAAETAAVAPSAKGAKPVAARKPVSKAPPAPLPWSPPPRKVEDVAAETPAIGEGIHITALELHHCRFPVGRGADGHETYCGCAKSIHGGSYCEAHAKRTHTEWPPRMPARKLPTRLAREMSTLPDHHANRTLQRRA